MNVATLEIRIDNITWKKFKFTRCLFSNHLNLLNNLFIFLIKKVIN